MTDIILNLKEVVFKAESPKTYTVRLEKEGPGPVLAGDIKVVDGLTVLNPDHQIATLDKKGPLSMELTVNVGRGYVLRRAQQEPDHADRHHPDRRAVLADPQGELHRAERARRPGHRLRQAGARGVDQRRGAPGRRGGVRRQDPEGAALHLDQLRRDAKRPATTSVAATRSR